MHATSEFQKMMAHLQDDEWAHPVLPNEHRKVDVRSELDRYDDYRYWFSQMGHILVQNYQLSIHQAANVLNETNYHALRRDMVRYPLQDYQTIEELMADLKEKTTQRYGQNWK